MTRKLINIGISVNDKSGDPLRVAFDKINQNFTEIYTFTENFVESIRDDAAGMLVDGYHQGIQVAYDNITKVIDLTVAMQTVIATNPPSNPMLGSLWYNLTDHSLYVYDSAAWVITNQLYSLPIATNVILGGVKIDNTTIVIDNTGTISVDVLGNLSISDQTISGNDVDGDINIIPNGTGYVYVPSLKLPVGSLVQQTSSIEIIVDNLILDTLVDYSTDDLDNLSIGDYGLLNGISGSNGGWAVYQVSTTASTIHTEDVISGINIPLLSEVLFIGSGIYSNIIITNKTIPDPLILPLHATTVFIVRPVVNASLVISTVANTDISLNATSGGNVITHSSIIPISTSLYDLGTPTKRFKRLWLGAGSIYVQDEILGIDLRITAIDGNLVITGGAGLAVGEFTFRGNQLYIGDPARDLIIGTIDATADVIFNRPIVVNTPVGNHAFGVDRTGRVSLHPPRIPAGDSGAINLIGTADGSYQPVINAGGMLHITGYDGDPSRITMDTFGTGNLPIFVGRSARGTAASPTPTISGDILARYAGLGFANINYYPTGATLPSSIEFSATENYTSSAFGSKSTIYTYAIGTLSRVASLTIDSNNISLPISSGITFGDASRQQTAWLGTYSYTNLTELPDLTAYQLLTDAFSGSWTDLADKPSNISYWTNDLNYLTSGSTLLWSNLSGVPSIINSVAASTGITINNTGGAVTIAATGILSVIAATGTGQISVNNVGQNITLTLPQAIATTSNLTFHDLNITGTLSVADFNLSSAPTIAGKLLFLAADSTIADDIDGGGIVLGPLSDSYARTFLYNLLHDRWDTDGAGLVTRQLNADTIIAQYSVHVGNSYNNYDFPNAAMQTDASADTYVQNVIKNHSDGFLASVDYVATNNIGNDTSHYIDMGIVSSTYAESSWPILAPNDGYLYINGGNLLIGTDTTAKVIQFFTGGTTLAEIRASIDNTGLSVNGTVTASSFIGNVSGNAATVTNGVYTNGSYSNPSWITGLDYSKITNHPVIFSSAYIGTTNVSFNRASAIQDLTGISIDGNAGTVTNGVYTMSDQTITGIKTFSSLIAGSINGNSATVTNGVYTNGSYNNPSWIAGLDYSKITNHPAIFSSAYIGTTNVSFNRVSAIQDLTGVNIDGNAGTVTSISGNTVTSLQVTDGLGYTPYSITNPSGFTNNVGTVTNVSALTIGITGSDVTSTITNSTSTPVITLNIPTASALNRGALSSTDWSAFNNKGNGTVTSVSSTTLTIAGTSAIPTVNLSSGIVTIGTTGSSTLIPVITVDTYGRITGVTAAANPQGTVTNISALTIGTTGTDITSTVASGTSTPVITLNIPTASALNRGVLSSTDWSAFNNKGNGTVTSVGGTGTVSGLTLSGSITTLGNLTLGGTLAVSASNFTSQSANTILAAPVGTAGIPIFRVLSSSDIPNNAANTSGSAGSVVANLTFNTSGGASAGTSYNGGTARTIDFSTVGAYAASNPSGFTTNTGTVTSVAALTLGTTGSDISSTVTNGSTSPVITLNIPTSSALNRGLLSATDWSNFNNKGVGTVTSVVGTGTVSGLTLSGTVTASGNITLGGTLSAVTSAVAGTGIGVSSSTGAVTFTNTGVTSVTAGTGISVSSGTGGITITNTATSGTQPVIKTVSVQGDGTFTATSPTDDIIFSPGGRMQMAIVGNTITITDYAKGNKKHRVKHKSGVYETDIDAITPEDSITFAEGNTGIVITSDVITQTITLTPIATVRSINYVIDGGGSVITTGSKGHLVIDFACTINSWTMLGDVSGSIVVDIKRGTYANYPTTVSIAGTNKPTFSSVLKNQNITLTGWGSTALLAGDILEFTVDSAVTVTRVTLDIKVTPLL
jgi:hypothetical protein